MIEIVTDLPANIVGLRARGRITARDYKEVVIPAVEAGLKQRDKIRLYYELGTAFEGIDPGAILEDLEIGISKLPHWEKLAVVTDTAWIRHAVSAFAFAIHGKVRVFAVADAAAARKWIAES